MENDIKYFKESFIETIIDNGFTEAEAIKSWEVVYNTYSSYLSKFTLAGVSNMTDREILDYLKTSGELNEMTEKALQRVKRL